MTNLFGNYRCYLVTLLCLPLCGCVSWTGPAANLVPASTTNPTLPSEKFRPVVRGNQAQPAATPAQHEATSQPRTTDDVAPTTPRQATGSARQVPPPVVRGQQPDGYAGPAPDELYPRTPMAVSGGTASSPSPGAGAGAGARPATRRRPIPTTESHQLSTHLLTLALFRKRLATHPTGPITRLRLATACIRPPARRSAILLREPPRRNSSLAPPTCWDLNPSLAAWPI